MTPQEFDRKLHDGMAGKTGSENFDRKLKESLDRASKVRRSIAEIETAQTSHMEGRRVIQETSLGGKKK